MPSPAVQSAVDVATWFADQARREDLYLQPQKLQRLLYIAQGSYAAMHYGRKLMPATFVADETGPVEPNIFRIFELGRPKVTTGNLPPEIEHFLSRIWRKYCHHATDYINKQIQYHDIYRNAIKRGVNEEIPFEEMAKFFAGIDKDRKKPGKVVTKDGRKLQKWVPGAKAAAKPTNRV